MEHIGKILFINLRRHRRIFALLTLSCDDQ